MWAASDSSARLPVISPPITSMSMYVAVSPNAMVSGRTYSAAADPGLGPWL